MTVQRPLRQQLIDTAAVLHRRGWVANHDGNISVRTGDDRFVATPTATSKARIDHQNLIEVNREGKQISGTARPFSEMNLHLTVYAQRPDVRAVVHAHPPDATAIACSGSEILARAFMPEVVVSLGASIPTVPFALPGAAAAGVLAPYTREFDAVLLGNHGVLAWGADLEQAYLRLELVEHVAMIARRAQSFGGVVPLPEAALGPLLAARARAGLGLAASRPSTSRPSSNADGGAAKPVHAQTAAAPQSSAAELARIVREELLSALGKQPPR